jgi:hypothetical protein
MYKDYRARMHISNMHTRVALSEEKKIFYIKLGCVYLLITGDQKKISQN